MSQQALAEYEVAIKLSPNRLNGLYNAGKAVQRAQVTRGRQSHSHAALLKSTGNGANTTRPELTHAKAYVSELN